MYDENIGSAVPMQEMKALQSLLPRRPTTRERLLEQKSVITTRLKEIDEALAALDSNPEFERIHNLLNKVL